LTQQKQNNPIDDKDTTNSCEKPLSVSWVSAVTAK